MSMLKINAPGEEESGHIGLRWVNGAFLPNYR